MDSEYQSSGSFEKSIVTQKEKKKILNFKKKRERERQGENKFFSKRKINNENQTNLFQFQQTDAADTRTESNSRWAKAPRANDNKIR